MAKDINFPLVLGDRQNHVLAHIAKELKTSKSAVLREALRLYQREFERDFGAIPAVDSEVETDE